MLTTTYIVRETLVSIAKIKIMSTTVNKIVQKYIEIFRLHP